MANPTPRFAQEARLKFIDGLFFWEGRANRRDLMDAFQVSEPQAAIDLKTYLAKLAPNQVSYDTRARRYEAQADFAPLYGPPDLAAWLARSAAKGIAVEVLPSLERPINAALMAELYRAIRDRTPLVIDYQSMTRPANQSRWISPTAFVSDGQRWHVRAYCHLREEYRDFVVSRISLTDEAPASDPNVRSIPADVDWESWVTLDLAPAPGLAPAQCRAVAHDYGFTESVLSVRVRLALEFYALRRWGLDRPESRLAVVDRRLSRAATTPTGECE